MTGALIWLTGWRLAGSGRAPDSATLFRLSCENYVRDHGGKYDIPTLDDFLCQENTGWSGLGVIDILASTLDLTESQRRDLRSCRDS